MLKSVKAQDYMSKQWVTFKPSTDLFTAINQLLEYRLCAAPVVDEQGRLVGILAETDCLKAILTLTYHEEEKGGTVGDYMSTQVRSIASDADIIAAAKIFIETPHSRLPVLSDGVIVGLLSRTDVLRAVEEFAQEG